MSSSNMISATAMPLATVLLTLVLSLQGAEPFSCYSCSNVTSVSQCTQITTCASSGEICRQDYTDTSTGKLFTLGCVDSKMCPPSSTISPGNVIGRAASRDTCSECCQTDNCNRQLCQQQEPTCADHGDFDCATIGATINYCDEPHRAVTYCKRFCGFCSWRNGGWSTWESWSDCTVTCGTGSQSRARQCDNPVPADGGDNCVGNSSQTQSCTLKACPDGGWSTWSSWSTCSHSCGDGMASRSRTCDNPLPSISGRFCAGDSSQIHSCKVRNCPVKVLAFTATQPTNGGNGVVFSNVVLNEGGDYHSSTGNFVCSIPGVYFFTATIIKEKSSDDSKNDFIKGIIRQNAIDKVEVCIDPEDQYADRGGDSISLSATLRLNIGDIADVWVEPASDIMDHRSMFSGFLIQPDGQ